MRKKIDYGSEFSEAREARNDYMYVITRLKKEREDARQKWNNLSIKAADRATNFEEALVAYRFSPCGMSARKYTQKRMEDLCATTENVLEYQQIVKCYDRSFASGKWTELALVEIDQAQSFRESAKIYTKVYVHEFFAKDSDITKKALEKALNFCSCYSKLKRLTRYGGRVPKDLIYLYEDKLIELMSKASNLEKAAKIFKNKDFRWTKNENIYKEGLLIVLGLCSTRKELEEALDREEIGHTFECLYDEKLKQLYP